jgi:hypothetical protein
MELDMEDIMTLKGSSTPAVAEDISILIRLFLLAVEVPLEVEWEVMSSKRSSCIMVESVDLYKTLLGNSLDVISMNLLQQGIMEMYSMNKVSKHIMHNKDIPVLMQSIFNNRLYLKQVAEVDLVRDTAADMRWNRPKK